MSGKPILAIDETVAEIIKSPISKVREYSLMIFSKKKSEKN